MIPANRRNFIPSKIHIFLAFNFSHEGKRLSNRLQLLWRKAQVKLDDRSKQVTVRMELRKYITFLSCAKLDGFILFILRGPVARREGSVTDNSRFEAMVMNRLLKYSLLTPCLLIHFHRFKGSINGYIAKHALPLQRSIVVFNKAYQNL